MRLASRVVLALLLLLPASAYAVDFNLQLDVAQGVNGSSTLPFGYITSMKVGNTVLAADIQVMNAATKTTMPVVGVLRTAYWNTSATGQLQFLIELSAKNYAAAIGPKAALSFSFIAYSYDAMSKVYYTSFSSNNTVLSGIVGAVSRDGQTMASPALYQWTLAISPAPVGQRLLLGYGPGSAVLKAWGVTVAADLRRVLSLSAAASRS